MSRDCVHDHSYQWLQDGERRIETIQLMTKKVNQGDRAVTIRPIHGQTFN